MIFPVNHLAVLAKLNQNTTNTANNSINLNNYKPKQL